MPQGSSRFTPMACRIPTACDWELTRSRPARRTLNCGWHTTTCYRALPRSSGCTMHIFVALWLHFGPTYIRRPCRGSQRHFSNKFIISSLVTRVSLMVTNQKNGWIMDLQARLKWEGRRWAAQTVDLSNWHHWGLACATVA
ncbi:hypothetical protein FIBSPDRAFT_434254 [Athelia psychrophila]|uniref:Uncharacterized protein n=1 Tax=Athelia psychrophila TaxID=1759441 RepID=A0A166VKU6_9AGAM|nr:hypothetical protein FIBSPDRAFT_434254 [Fibularhizoctonia sp. CBS 109695]